MSKYVEVPCVVCGRLYWVTDTKQHRMTCGDACWIVSTSADKVKWNERRAEVQREMKASR